MAVFNSLYVWVNHVTSGTMQRGSTNIHYVIDNIVPRDYVLPVEV